MGQNFRASRENKGGQLEGGAVRSNTPDTPATTQNSHERKTCFTSCNPFFTFVGSLNWDGVEFFVEPKGAERSFIGGQIRGGVTFVSRLGWDRECFTNRDSQRGYFPSRGGTWNLFKAGHK